MTLSALLPLVAAEDAVDTALDRCAASATAAVEVSAPTGITVPLLALLAQRSDGPVIAVTATTRQAEDLAGQLTGCLPADSVAMFPSWETLPHERLSPSADVVGRRMAVLRRLRHPGATAATGLPAVVVMPVRALLQPIAAEVVDAEPVAVPVGGEADPTEVARALVRIGYVRVDLVERRGQFALRGGILDVFPPTEAHPVRLEFFGDEVEEIRSFAVADQRSLEPLPDGLFAPPCRELPLTDAVRERARALIPRYPELTDLLDAVADGRGAEGVEAITPLLVERMHTVVDLLPGDARMVLLEPQRIEDRAEELLRTTLERRP